MPTEPNSPRDRLLETASALFYAEGIKGIGVDRVLAEAGVTRATMYRHFAGKEGLVAAYLEREDAIIRHYFAAAESAGGSAAEMLIAVIDGIAEDARRYRRRGCPFINAAAEYPAGEIRDVIDRHRTWFRLTLGTLCKAAGIADAEYAAAALVLLRDAALVGVYLDGDAVTKTFCRTARQVVGLA
ncbi:TetR/AcrR family transcriptional regulator [Pseudomonas sp. MPFS]|uniref:TetR/AcrR family transcriptional regulator n=1 Tax=Pseudomonas sp. MPFS TaxID=2795724 RepID=UPI001F12ED0A|nr:TetR/AcrR family transcriptional regulator [Pseudomonas sp. MPFS]UMZ12091.1 TetR/AcrR family transcriptional regulator [Pseudomonas sp. MPFS]